MGTFGFRINFVLPSAVFLVDGLRTASAFGAFLVDASFGAILVDASFGAHTRLAGAVTCNFVLVGYGYAHTSVSMWYTRNSTQCMHV